jgi:Protein of unknown function (DUF1186)
MSAQPYTSPVNKLFQQGDPDLIRDWSSYLKLGITAKHIDELARMAIDRAFFEEDEEDSGWVLVHAWRTLAMLQETAAIDPLIQVLRQLSDEQDPEAEFDWVSEELPLVLGRMGQMALPAVAACLGEDQVSNRVRENAVMAIAEIANENDQTRLDCVAIVTQQLANFADNDPDYNGFLVMVLVGSLLAVESAAVIEQAFESDRVKLEIIRNWDEAQVFLGLKEPPPLNVQFPDLLSSSASESEDKVHKVPYYSSVPKSKSKAKRKAQSQSRKANRKKK